VLAYAVTGESPTPASTNIVNAVESNFVKNDIFSTFISCLLSETIMCYENPINLYPEISG
jgi:hypothetical protein